MITIHTEYNKHRFSEKDIRFIKDNDTNVMIQYDHIAVTLECVDEIELSVVLNKIDEYIQKDIIK